MTMQNDQNRRPGFLEKRHGTRESCGCGDNRGGVCLNGATSFVKCQAKPRLALSGQSNRTGACPLSDKSGQRRILARDGLSANDPKRTSALHFVKSFDAEL
jgi:hypothetical protein